MNLIELDGALRKLRLSGMADAMETRLRQAQTEKMVPLDIVSALVSDELLRRQDRLFERRTKLARFRDPDRSLASFDFEFNKKMNRDLVYELAEAGSSPAALEEHLVAARPCDRAARRSGLARHHLQFENVASTSTEHQPIDVSIQSRVR